MMGNLKHGHYTGRKASREYISWNQMMGRCYNPNNPSFKQYGGRGIIVCDRWHEVTNFLADVGERPLGQSLERINNLGNYEPGNCKWATPRQQARNRRDNRLTMAKAREIRMLVQRGYSHRELAKEFGCNNISRIVNNQIWREEGGEK
jgi:hypothetical protein